MTYLRTLLAIFAIGLATLGFAHATEPDEEVEQIQESEEAETENAQEDENADNSDDPYTSNISASDKLMNEEVEMTDPEG